MFGRRNNEEVIMEEETVDEAIESVSEETTEIQSYIDKKFDEMTRELEEKSSLQMQRVDDTIGKLTNGLNQLLSGMKSELEAVKNIALEKEVKIQRYEEGYDQKNIKNFLGDLLRITDFANSNKETADSLNEIYEDLELLLEDAGVEKSVVAVADWNTPKFFELVYAITAAGGVIYPVNIRLPPEQIAYTLEKSESQILIYSDDVSRRIEVM